MIPILHTQAAQPELQDAARGEPPMRVQINTDDSLLIICRLINVFNEDCGDRISLRT
jgi:hypothetical protein